MDRIVNYKNKLLILKQIHSNKAQFYKIINTIQNIITIIVSGFLTFIGFYGNEKIVILLSKFSINVDISIIEFIFSLLVFFIFLLVIFHLVFNIHEKQSISEKAVNKLSIFINELKDIIETKNDLSQNLIENIKYKYMTIIDILPPNSDKDYLKAKKDFTQKSKKGLAIINKIDLNFFNEEYLKNYYKYLVKEDYIYSYLEEIRSINNDLYLTGGVIRSLVWDVLHSYKSRTPIYEVDIIYFNKSILEKNIDYSYEKKLSEKFPNINWSVKNQARMHTRNNDEPYESLFDSLSKCPETCTSIAIKLNKNDEIEIISPYGLSDLFRLIVTPTPYYTKRKSYFKQRYTSKNWQNKWGKLRIIF
ncbi:nucleotidyltransferase family protein [Aliarcobacter butzleri]|uniref:nucleotidyltransferase family protein n=1 Tax=Aliarcobacter butzleri TaxID=28197 RepID=UPI003B2158C5